MNIGQPVLVKAITRPGYTHENNGTSNRVLESFEVVPFQAVIIGQRRKMVGKVYPAWHGMEETEPASLSPTGSELLWEVRHGMQNVPLLVRAEDLEECEEFEVPSRAGRVD